MSSSSGIAPSQAVIDAFNGFCRSLARALILKIENEAIVVDQEIQGSGSLELDFGQLQSLLSNSQSRYVFVRDGSIVFISFVPDFANVREKMIYASTKANMLRQLGSTDLITKQYLINDLDDVSWAGYQELQKSEQVAAPLTESEKSLKQISEAEAAFTTKRSLVRMDHLSNLGLVVDDDVFAKVQQIQENELVRVKINSDEVVYFVDLQNVSVEQVPAAVAQMDGPQYVFYKNSRGHVVFIYSCPSGSKIRERMLYALTKQGFLAKLKDQGAVVDKLVEVGDADEIEVGDIQEESTVAQGVARFSKPRGPRRR